MPGLLLRGDPPRFGSCKRPPPVSDRSLFAFWVVAYGRFDCIIIIIIIIIIISQMNKKHICEWNISLKRAQEGLTLFVKHTFFLCRFPKLCFCCSSLLAAALHSGQSLEIRSLTNWYLLSFNFCINSVRSSRTWSCEVQVIYFSFLPGWSGMMQSPAI